MPRNITITFNDGSSHRYENIPDTVTPDMIEARVSKDFPGKRITNIDGGKAGAVVQNSNSENPQQYQKLVNKAKDAVADQMLDPDNAKFRKVFVDSKGIVRGLVNGKNQMGGYVGFVPFSYDQTNRILDPVFIFSGGVGAAMAANFSVPADAVYVDQR